MANKGTSVLAAAVVAAQQGMQGETATAGIIPGTTIASGMARTGELMRGDRKTVVQIMVDPNRCRLWKMHNRIQADLNEMSCADLVAGFKSSGRQLIPAIARRISDDPDHDYEIIIGSRRRWTAAYLGWKLLIEVRDLTDREAFRDSDIDNRDRKDVSPWERALDYQRAVDNLYKSVQQMSDDIGVTTDTLYKYLRLARLPAEILAAFGGHLHFPLRATDQVTKLLQDENRKSAIMAKAAEFAAAANNGTRATTDAVLAALKKAASGIPGPKRAVAHELKTAKGKVFGNAVIARKRATLTLDLAAGATIDEFVAECRRVWNMVS